jgi:hypothetical protein
LSLQLVIINDLLNDVSSSEYKSWYIFEARVSVLSITVTSRSKAWTVFARSNAGFVGSNPTQNMDVYMSLFRIYVVLCVGSGFTTGWSPV